MRAGLRAIVLLSAAAFLAGGAAAVDKLSYHQDAARTGWNPQETTLTLAAVADPRFGQIWQSPQFDSGKGRAPRLFATPLFVEGVEIAVGPHAGRTLAVLYAFTDLG